MKYKADGTRLKPAPFWFKLNGLTAAPMGSVSAHVEAGTESLPTLPNCAPLTIMQRVTCEAPGPSAVHPTRALLCLHPLETARQRETVC